MPADTLAATGSTLPMHSTMEGETGQAGSILAGTALRPVADSTYAMHPRCAQRLMNQGIGRAASLGAAFGAGGTLFAPVLKPAGAPMIANTQAFAVATYTP